MLRQDPLASSGAYKARNVAAAGLRIALYVALDWVLYFAGSFK